MGHWKEHCKLNDIKSIIQPCLLVAGASKVWYIYASHDSTFLSVVELSLLRRWPWSG
jgi:hypothetical protein